MRCILLLALPVLILAGCDSRRIYEYNQDFKNRTWRVNDTASFEFAILDPGKKYNLYYNVRNSLEYPYARLFVQYSLQDSAGLELRKQLVSAFLFDQKSGRPEGSSGLGDVYDHQYPLISDFEFRAPGKYRMKLEQFMRMDTLPGILAVGLRVEESEKK